MNEPGIIDCFLILSRDDPGESLPVELSTEPTDTAGEEAHAHALHSRNMAFSSALVVEGA